MNPQISNLVIMLAMMQVSRRLDMENPDIIFYVRVAYGSSVAVAWIIYQIARNRILQKNDLTTLKFVAPANPMSGETEGKLQVTTVRDYDLKEIDSAVKSIYTGLAMMGFMHLYMKYTNPLLMQSISPIKSALEHNEVRIHLFGKPASGDLKRPFKAPSMFGGFGAPPAAKTDKKSIEEAERAGTGGVKAE
ncbi:LAQU0S04e06590g1_1 [Lachancea quebecensis]|uniref:LAQU0S04e06590g1_1 n=1 Tax=Lachancea quebecensis TaxID=1654605 RepID=A0A0P1KQY4_9SACH|nr:LAQU0S04e06590g1_1 [Lachancea quebecensis]